MTYNAGFVEYLSALAAKGITPEEQTAILDQYHAMEADFAALGESGMSLTDLYYQLAEQLRAN